MSKSEAIGNSAVIPAQAGIHAASSEGSELPPPPAPQAGRRGGNDGREAVTEIRNGWLGSACRMPSPNFDARPAGESIDLIVIHNISLPPGCYGQGHIGRLFSHTLDTTAHPFFARLAGVRVSAHLLIERSGATTQFVSFDDSAWHAGTSVFEGRTGCNAFSIGIELEGTDFEAFTDAQYERLGTITGALTRVYPIRALRGHCDVASSRKTDPGPYFCWRRIGAPSSVSVPSF